ncbi:Dot/Icm T4SS effector VpdC [Legionella dresdenensis]|uniref:Dot/Icm T4SS effector VpdC n=1 Tax=Legionella dresdenensis TaxID=450200 RepID=A0ABV8CHW3_9GAMM
MTKESVLNKLLQQQTANTLLLKKFFLCVHKGWFRINGAAPDNQIDLGRYLLNNERVMLDFTRLRKPCRDKFTNWFIQPHFHDARSFLSGVATTEYRGYTAEVGLSWWGYLFHRKKSLQWPLMPFELTRDYQLNSLEICEGANGLSIGLNQFAVGNQDDVYLQPDYEQNKPILNTKRLFLTESLVEDLIKTNINELCFQEILNSPHPFSIPVNNYQARANSMYEHRKTERFITPQPWYLRLYLWIKALFSSQMANQDALPKKNFQPLITSEKLRVMQCSNTGEILVQEKRPDLDTLVLCGGGAKVFAHIGAFNALETNKIPLKKYAGSSAGAMMAILCYLGYNTNDIMNFFRGLRHENLIYYEIDRSGLSDTVALKAALDYMIVKKVNEIIKKYRIDESEEGRLFLATKVFKNGIISFSSAKALKERYPDCGIGDELIITATNKITHKTRYLPENPEMEISAAGTMSACYPVLFKHYIYEGEPHNDGGLLSNLPVEVFKGTSSLLESMYGNCVNLIACQFDNNGYERGLLDKFVEHVHRENPFLNWFYGFITGVKDPVSGWERDRLKVLLHSHQVLVYPTNDVSATQFTVEQEKQSELFHNGYKAAIDYLKVRYKLKDGEPAKNKEYFHTMFSCLEELLYFCCYRGNKEWFNKIAEAAEAQGMDVEKIQRLRQEYFHEPEIAANNPHYDTFFNAPLSVPVEREDSINRMRFFEALYPVFDKFSNKMVGSKDLEYYKKARHARELADPLKSLTHLKKITGETHVLLYILIQLLTNFQNRQINTDEICKRLKLLEKLSEQQIYFSAPQFYGKWQLDALQTNQIYTMLECGKWTQAMRYCEKIARPPKMAVKADVINQQGMSNDDFDNGRLERNRPGISA